MIKILFIDTSALLSFFVHGKGTLTMRWLFSSENTTRYIINHQVVTGFEKHLSEMVSRDEIKKSTANSILTLFNTHYKNRKLKIVGKDASIQATMEGVYNYLGGISRPVLVTCHQEQATEIQTKGYPAINPEIQTTAEINEILTEGAAVA